LASAAASAVTLPAGTPRSSSPWFSATAFDPVPREVASATGEPPRRRERHGRERGLDQIAGNERQEPGAQQLLARHVRRQRREPEREDRHAAEQHRREHRAEAAIPAAAAQPAGDERRERERREVAAGRPEERRRARRAAGEHRQAGRALDQVQRLRQGAATRAERGAGEQHGEGLPGDRHRGPRHRERDARRECRDETRADHEQRVLECAGARHRDVGEGQRAGR
jgi:hypothetical protein